MTEPLPDQPDFCWPIDPACSDTEWGDFEESVRLRAVALATSTLYRLVLGRVGGCAVQVRPCPQNGAEPFFPWQRNYVSYGQFGPALLDAAWVNCGCALRGCGCTTGCEIVLGGYVGKVDEVKVGSAVIDTADYKVIDNEKIVWQGTGDCPFPKRQDLSKPLGQDGTFSVTYLPARQVDGLGAYAAGVLAFEFAKACGGGKCRLPSNVTQLTRQGVSMTLISGSFPHGRTGIREVDTFIALHNPNGLTSAPRVYSPDLPSAVYES